MKTTFYGTAHYEQSYEYIPVYPSLRTKSIASTCTSGFETSVDSIAIALNLVSPISPSQYKPLQLPPILHEFPTKNYKYLPRFDG